MGFGVKREIVFAAFEAKGINYAPRPESAEEKHFFEVVGPNGEMNVEYIPPELGRKLPQRLSDLYEIPIQWFYTPSLISKIASKPQTKEPSKIPLAKVQPLRRPRP